MHASLLICFTSNVSRVTALIPCIGEHFKFRLLDCVRYIGVLFHTFTVTLAGLKNIVRSFVVSRI